MADISKINVNNTTYNLKDSRIPNLNSSTTQYLCGDGTWASPTVQTMSGNVDVSDENTYLLIEPGSGGGGTYARTVVIPQQTVSGSRTPTLTHTAALENGEYYIVTLDGTEYTCTGRSQWSNAAVVIGDMNFYYTVPNEYDYPFAVGYEISSDGADCALLDSNSHTIKVEHLEFVAGGVTLTGKTITSNGTYDPASDNADGYSSVTVNVPSGQPNLQAKTNISPTTSSQTIQPDSGYDGLSSVQINAMPSGTAGTPTAAKGTVSNHQVSVTPSVTNTTGYITGSTKTGTAVTVSASELVSGSETKTANGTYDVTNLAELVVNVPAGKNAQMQSMSKRTSSNAYTDMGFEITVAKAGTYDVYWTGYRSSTGGTNGAQIYKNDTAVGNPQTTFDGTYTNCQNGHVSNLSCAVNDKITIRARARSSSYYMYIMNLAIIEA